MDISERRISLIDILRLIKFSRKNSIDIIHAHGKGAGLIARIIKIFLQKPLIYTFHGIHTHCLSRLNRFLYIFYENITGWLDDEKVFVSKSERNQTKYLKIPIGKNNCIINNATKNSFIILDEVGRGTSTFDGLSLAWSITEYLHNNEKHKARTLLATHYHELISLAEKLKDTFNLNVQIKEYNDEIIFMRKVVDGGADKSYGIQVAEMAGLPNEVIARSKLLLKSAK